MSEMAPHPLIDAVRLEDVLRALADPLRLRIAAILVDGDEHACGEFGRQVTRATMSHHFQVLRLAGIISTRVDGRKRYIRLRKEELDKSFPGLIQLLETQSTARP